MDFQEEWRRKYRIRLDTPRLTLRPLVAEDVDWLAELYADPEVNRYLWDGIAASPEKARKTAEAVISLDAMRFRFGCWAIEDKATGMVHGWVELSKLRPWVGPSDEIGLSYVLGVRSWGQGIATEAAGRLLSHGFEAGLDVVMAVINEKNTASRRVLEKIGMRSIGNPDSLGQGLEFFRIERPGWAEAGSNPDRD